MICNKKTGDPITIPGAVGSTLKNCFHQTLFFDKTNRLCRQTGFALVHPARFAVYTQPMDIAIRKARLADSGRISDLLRCIDLFPAVQAEGPAETLQRIQRHVALCLGDDSHSVYIAEDKGGALLAYATVHWLPYMILKGPEGFVSELFVDAAARGQGIGTRLLEIVEAEARQRGCARLSLINMRNRESFQRGFYAKLGWQERPDAANFVLLL